MRIGACQPEQLLFDISYNLDLNLVRPCGLGPGIHGGLDPLDDGSLPVASDDLQASAWLGVS
jgi:hypothetical protein